jgi:hypothetical protein
MIIVGDGAVVLALTRAVVRFKTASRFATNKIHAPHGAIYQKPRDLALPSSQTGVLLLCSMTQGSIHELIAWYVCVEIVLLI